MKIFFGLSLRAEPRLHDEYHAIYHTIENLGHENLNDIAVNTDPDEFYKMGKAEIEEMNKDLSKKIHSADIVVIEATTHSLTMGYYTKMALDLNKPVIILHLPGNTPFYFSGIEHDRLQIVEYTLDSLVENLQNAINFAQEKIDVRFNLFISPEINNYLNWVSKKFDIQKSPFIRTLIIEHMKAHQVEYSKELER